MINETYKKFFIDTKNEKAIVVQGGRRSGKTWAILEWLVILSAAAQNDIVVAAPTYIMLKNTIADFEALTHIRVEGKRCKVFSSQWRFMSFSHYTKAQGIFADYVFFNECATIPEKVIKTFSLGVRKQMIFDFNPVAKFWIDDFINSKNFLQTTWEHNKNNLSENQIEYFLELKKNKDNDQQSRYMYDVYYCGNYGKVEGMIYVHFEKEKSPIEMRKPVIGIDFGYKDDPTAIVAVEVVAGEIKVNELAYVYGADDAAITEILKEIGIDASTPIVYDWGAGGDVRAANIMRMIGGGLSMIPAKKGSVVEEVKYLSTMGITAFGENIAAEANEYRLYNDMLTGADHALDAMRYAVMRGLKSNFWRKL